MTDESSARPRFAVELTFLDCSFRQSGTPTSSVASRSPS